MALDIDDPHLVSYFGKMVNHLIPDLLVDAHAALGEGPRWSTDLDRLLWLDIDGGLLHVTDPSTGSNDALEIGLGV
jgi:sugar lactone lactonase YvrE